MPRIAMLALATATAAAALGPAEAAVKPTPRTRPVATTLYLHGAEPLGELESFPLVADQYLTMDPEEPTASEPRSKQITNYVAGPNTQCAGNTLFPVWVGELRGRVRGDVTVTFHTLSTPGSVDVRIWADVATLLCNSAATGTMDYPPPDGEVRVNLPPGQATVEALIEDVSFRARSVLMVQITPVTLPPFFGRVLYDSTSMPSRVEFRCSPASGRRCA